MGEKPPKIVRVRRASKSIVTKASEMSRAEARQLVGYYFKTTGLRRSATHKYLRLKRMGGVGEEHPMLNYVRLESERLVNQIVQGIDIYADAHVASRWARSFKGTPNIGPLVSAGLQAFVDPEKAVRISQVYRYAGLDPSCKWWWNESEVQSVLQLAKLKFGEPDLEDTVRWIAKQINVGYRSFLRRCYIPSSPEITWRSLRYGIKRMPWNPKFKKICYFLGMTILRNRNNPDHFYGQLYDWRKKYEEKRNEEGYNEDRARENLRKRYDTIDREGSPYKAFIQGKLPPHHIDKMARRWVIKLFLEHFHRIAFYERYSMLPPTNYRVSIMGGRDRYQCPNWPFSTSRPFKKRGYDD